MNMSKKVVLFVIAGRAETEEAKNLLNSELPQFQHEVVRCPPSMEEKFLMPFMRHGNHPYFGISGIRGFARTQHART